LRDTSEQNKEIMQSMDLEDDEDDSEAVKLKKKNARAAEAYDSGSSDTTSDEEEDEDDDDDDESDVELRTNNKRKGVNGKSNGAANGDDDDDDESDNPKHRAKKGFFIFHFTLTSKKVKNLKFYFIPKIVKLSPEELAIGDMIVNSNKTKSDLIDDSYNRYSTFDDPEALPEWFVEDEKEHWRKDSVADRRLVSEYRKRTEDINARPIKKVVEAQARKKRRVNNIKQIFFMGLFYINKR
jgi:AdoMet-dependent rRNA methyltransferase SPB1